MIEAVMIFNVHGTPRLTKFYRHYPEDKQHQIIKQVFQIVAKRSDSVCNFIEGGDILGDKNLKIIYRHYATLYMVFCVDTSESELAILDLIQVFVEILDKCFKNVCELDLVFHVDKVHYVLNEIVMGGLVMENSMADILQALEEQKKLEKNEFNRIPSVKLDYNEVMTILHTRCRS